MFVIILTIYDLFIWIYRLFFRRVSYLQERLKVMEYELTKKYPFNDSCANHVNVKDNEHVMRGRINHWKQKTKITIYSFSTKSR